MVKQIRTETETLPTTKTDPRVCQKEKVSDPGWICRGCGSCWDPTWPGFKNWLPLSCPDRQGFATGKGSGHDKQIRIMILRRRARKLCLYIHQRSMMSCGARLADFIRPDIPRAVAWFNETMADLALIDPAAKEALERNGPLT
jgi:hypothetical protein